MRTPSGIVADHWHMKQMVKMKCGVGISMRERESGDTHGASSSSYQWNRRPMHGYMARCAVPKECVSNRKQTDCWSEVEWAVEVVAIVELCGCVAVVVCMTVNVLWVSTAFCIRAFSAITIYKLSSRKRTHQANPPSLSPPQKTHHNTNVQIITINRSIYHFGRWMFPMFYQKRSCPCVNCVWLCASVHACLRMKYKIGYEMRLTRLNIGKKYPHAPPSNVLLVAIIQFTVWCEHLYTPI